MPEAMLDWDEVGLLIPNPNHNPDVERAMIMRQAANGGELSDDNFRALVQAAEFVVGTTPHALKKAEILGKLSYADSVQLRAFRLVVAEKVQNAAKLQANRNRYVQYVVDPSVDASGRLPEDYIRNRYKLFFPEDTNADSKPVADMQLELFLKFKDESIVDAFEFLFAREWGRWNRSEQEIVYKIATHKQKTQLDRMGACALLHCN